MARWRFVGCSFLTLVLVGLDFQVKLSQALRRNLSQDASVGSVQELACL